MKKRPFYRNTYLWTILCIVVSFAVWEYNDNIGFAFFLIASVLLIISILSTIISFFKRILKSRSTKQSSKRDQSDNSEIKSADSASFFDKDVIYSSVPQEYCECKLVYSYDDVKFNCTFERMVKDIPENMRLTMKLDQNDPNNEQSAALFYKNIPIGYLYNNKLKTMVMDFAADPDRHVLILGREWEGEPMVKLCFYKPDKNQIRFDDDDDDYDDD